MRGTATDLLLLAGRLEDADTLFFQRRLVLTGDVDPATALGVWLRSDFRFAPLNSTPTEIWGLVVLVAAVLGVVWWVRQRDVLIPLVGLACVVIWWVSDQSQSPYSVAKALALISPFVLLVAGRFLLAPHRGLRRPMRLIPLGVGLAVLGAAGWSSAEALRNAQVGPYGRLQDLQALRPIVQGQPTLFLGTNDFATWALWGSHVAQPFFPGPDLQLREAKGWELGQTADIDTVTSESLDRVNYVVAVRGDGEHVHARRVRPARGPPPATPGGRGCSAGCCRPGSH